MGILRIIISFFMKEGKSYERRHNKPDREKTIDFKDAKQRLRQQQESLKVRLEETNLNIVKFERLQKNAGHQDLNIQESMDTQKNYADKILAQIKNINKKILEMDMNKANLHAQFGIAEITFDNEVEKDPYNPNSVISITELSSKKVSEFENLTKAHRDINNAIL